MPAALSCQSSVDIFRGHPVLSNRCGFTSCPPWVQQAGRRKIRPWSQGRQAVILASTNPANRPPSCRHDVGAQLPVSGIPGSGSRPDSFVGSLSGRDPAAGACRAARRMTRYPQQLARVAVSCGSPQNEPRGVAEPCKQRRRKPCKTTGLMSASQ